MIVLFPALLAGNAQGIAKVWQAISVMIVGYLALLAIAIVVVGILVRRNRRGGKAILLGALLGLYIISFGLPLMDHSSHIHEWADFFRYDGESFTLGVFPGFFGPMYAVFYEKAYQRILICFSWLANPCFWYGCACLRREKFLRAAWFGFAAVVAALAGLWFLVDEEHVPLAAYWLWLTVMVLLTAAGVIGVFTTRKKPEGAPGQDVPG